MAPAPGAAAGEPVAEGCAITMLAAMLLGLVGAADAAGVVVNITYGRGMVCPATVATCKWGVPTNRSGYVSKELQLDFYPANTSSGQPPVKPSAGWPALIMVHGGAYWTGHKDDPIVVQRCQAFSQRGMAVFSINYRMTGDQGLVTTPANKSLFLATLLTVIRHRDLFGAGQRRCRRAGPLPTATI